MNQLRAQTQNSIDNDEAIAHTLQEELTNLAVAEANDERAAQAYEDSKAAALTLDWQDFPVVQNIDGVSTDWRESGGPFHGTGGSGQDGGLTTFSVDAGEGDMGPRKYGSSSHSKGKAKVSSSDYDAYQYGDDEENLTLALALSQGENQLDEEVAKRLAQLDSVPHVPRINAEVIPTLDAASVDHARLLERLMLYGLNERKIQGDGNCQFRALSDQLYLTPEHHEFVRNAIVTKLTADPDVYSSYVPMAYSEYLKKMAKSGEWGDHVTLQAASDIYGVRIWLITSFKDTSFIEIVPEKEKSKRVIYLSFWAEVHYNSIYPKGAAGDQF